MHRKRGEACDVEVGNAGAIATGRTSGSPPGAAQSSGGVCSSLMVFVVAKGFFELVLEDDDPAGGF